MQCLSCNYFNQETREIQQKMEEELSIKIQEYLANKKRDCKQKAVESAEIHVDSIIYEILQLNILSDTTKMILKPSSPLRPKYIKNTDSSAIEPYKSYFLTDTILK